uniref:NAD(P)H-quinone oxidoreductase subunit 5, chloroplastic n=1 Tax=Nephroselmis astigmatica TaxID=259378 RepID=A0A088CIF9_9CHLO|nr:subunit 5 of NADH-plastoquinone oxidoreductase [Nephroselmis astigmatica]AID67680.1 subunit 5 of NADH-plastoquinone oxidoreductase [Nephroselmis astigmatica]
MEWISHYVWLIPTFPLISSLISGVGLLSARQATLATRRNHAILAISGLVGSLFLSLLAFWDQIQTGHSFRWLIEWILTDSFRLQVGYLVDPLASLMLVLVTTVAICVMIYSDTYMKYDEGYVRFFAYLSLFTASMLGLILSPNLIQVYAFWELVGMCSYLLVGFWFTRPSAAEACQKAFITNRVGDFGLLLGILGLYGITGSFEFNIQADHLGDFLVQNPQARWFAGLVCGCVFLGPVAKSAQFPLHVWLPDAMEGPTPISALIHAATMVAAGIFLVARMFPVFDQLPLVMQGIAWTGTFTAFLGATIALTQSDLKKGLAYSTMSQLGYMMMAMGVGAYTASLFHLITHAYSKALLFLGSGSVIHGMEPVAGFNPAKNQNMGFMGGLKKWMPWTSWTFLIGTASICGFPPFACFWSKDAILAETFNEYPICWLIAWLTAGMTSFYMFRIYFLTFEGDFRGDQLGPQTSSPKESSPGMVAPLVILTIPTITIGWIGTPFQNWFEELIHPPGPWVPIEVDFEEFFSMAGSSVGIAVIGFACASLLYREQRFDPIELSRRFASLNRLSQSKWYIDEFYDLFLVRGTRRLANQLLAIDQRFFDGAVNTTGLGTLLTAETLKYTGSGQVQNYLLFILGSISLFGLTKWWLIP